MSDKNELFDQLKNAIAKDKLFIITGTGVSNGVQREKGGTIPSWGKLVQSLKEDELFKECAKTLDNKQLTLLENLVPNDYVDDVHGDSLIEASQLMENIIGKEKFSEFIAAETREVEDAFSPTQLDIAKLPIKGIITFNYDRCHENAFKEENVDFQSCLYNNDKEMVKYINEDFESSPILLKAHGCISKPNSLILTSSSYFNILNKEHVYRAFLQHVLSRFTILILGFGLRDRDFDQILNTIEKDYGSNVQDCIAIMRIDPKLKDKEKSIQFASFATLESRYGLKVFVIDEYKEINDLLQKLRIEEGSFINDVYLDSIQHMDTDKMKKARKSLGKLSIVGRNQLRDLLLKNLKNCIDYINREEVLYVLGILKDNSQEVIEAFISECQKDNYEDIYITQHAECVAHSLIGLRSLYIEDIEVINLLGEQKLVNQMIKLDNSLNEKRLVNYLSATHGEVLQRHLFYKK